MALGRLNSRQKQIWRLSLDAPRNRRPGRTHFSTLLELLDTGVVVFGNETREQQIERITQHFRSELPENFDRKITYIDPDEDVFGMDEYHSDYEFELNQNAAMLRMKIRDFNPRTVIDPEWLREKRSLKHPFRKTIDESEMLAEEFTEGGDVASRCWGTTVDLSDWKLHGNRKYRWMLYRKRYIFDHSFINIPWLRKTYYSPKFSIKQSENYAVNLTVKAQPDDDTPIPDQCVDDSPRVQDVLKEVWKAYKQPPPEPVSSEQIRQSKEKLENIEKAKYKPTAETAEQDFIAGQMQGLVSDDEAQDFDDQDSDRIIRKPDYNSEP